MYITDSNTIPRMSLANRLSKAIPTLNKPLKLLVIKREESGSSANQNGWKGWIAVMKQEISKQNTSIEENMKSTIKSDLEEHMKTIENEFLEVKALKNNLHNIQEVTADLNMEVKVIKNDLHEIKSLQSEIKPLRHENNTQSNVYNNSEMAEWRAELNSLKADITVLKNEFQTGIERMLSILQDQSKS